MGKTSVAHINLLELLYFSGGKLFGGHPWEFYAYGRIELTFIPGSNDAK